MRFVAPLLALAAGCQTYDFEPVTPLTVAIDSHDFARAAIAPKPNLFMVVDKSGSMADPADPTSPACRSCDGGSCAASCLSRWQELKAATTQFLTASGTAAHLGMVPYPTAFNPYPQPEDAQAKCRAAEPIDIDRYGVPLDLAADNDDAALLATAQAVSKRLSGISPYGGTPTAATLEMLAAYEPLRPANGRRSYALLLTDGLPIACAAPSLTAPDQAGAVAAIELLRQHDISTIVVGFGAETGSTQGRDTLHAMAAAGGFTRLCTSDAECGAGDSCSVQVFDPCNRPSRACAKSYFQASSADQLAAALTQIRRAIDVCDPCDFELPGPAPDSDKLISVTVDNEAVEPGAKSWSYQAPIEGGRSLVHFDPPSPWCQRIMAATAEHPVRVVIKVAKAL